jgi:hypothetical protein
MTVHHAMHRVMPMQSDRLKRPWRPWPDKHRLDADSLAKTVARKKLANSVPARPGSDEKPPAKYPPYFSQAFPRGILPRLNLSTLCDPQKTTISSHRGPAVPKETSPRRRSPLISRSLDSLFDTALQTHRRSVIKGWCTERSHRLAREQRRNGSRFAPDHPPTPSEKLPGIDGKRNRRRRTPSQDRSASERIGHAGFVTCAGRQSLRGDLIVPLLDIATNSPNKEVQAQVPPALSALAGVGSNRAMLGAYGAVETMIGLAKSGKNTVTKLEAWDSLHQMMLSSEAVMRFLELGGIADAVKGSMHKDPRVKRMAATTLERILTRNIQPLENRFELEPVHALCRFVCCGDAKASESAGRTLWSIAKIAVQEGRPWPQESVLEVGKALVRDVEVIDEPSTTGQSRAERFMKGYTLTIKTLALLLTKQKAVRIALCKQDNRLLTMLYKSLTQTGEMLGRFPSEADLYYVRAIACLAISTRAVAMLNDTELFKWIVASSSRLLFILHDAMPIHWNARRKQIARLGEDEEGILPDEVEIHQAITLIATRNCFCLPGIRGQLIAEGFLPTLFQL